MGTLTQRGCVPALLVLPTACDLMKNLNLEGGFGELFRLKYHVRKKRF